ncbi:HAD family hydrolase [Lacticaseibacillus paracasei]|uniref:HAD family hydrolase n=1 Tax=Lacticaseibacillus paracasei TaxID=1597 RepID=UPI0021A46067|nr:HAD family hydrolase [Lacticaseibacillus paracasei]MCT4383789.1 phage tail protein [Lacticaseibacillus paracasei]
MEFYFVDRSFRLLGIATAGSDNTNDFRISGEVERTNVDAAMVAFTGTLYFPKKQLSKAEAMCQDLNYMLYMDDDGNGRMITITASHADGTGYCIAFEGTDAGNDLKNEIVGPYKAPTQMTFEQYFDIFTRNSGWDIGTNEISTDVRTLTFDSEETSYDRMNSVATQFGVETYFSFSIVGTTMVKCYLNVVKKRGADRGVTLRVGDEINRITVDSDSTNLMTSVLARGATPDGSNTPINLAGYSYTDPTGQFVLTKDGFLLDTVSNRIYSRLRQNSTATVEGGYLNHVINYNATTQASLLQSALADLKRNNHPAVNYTIELAKIPQNIHSGDTVQIEQEDRQLYLSARVLELDKCYSNPSSSTMVMGDYLIESSEIDPQYRALAQELAKQNKGKDGVGIQSSIVTYQAGTSGTTAPTGTWSEAIPTVYPSQFLWSRTVLTMTDGSSSTTYSVGKMGDTGKAGNGIQSSIVTYQVGISGTTAPTGTWSSTIPAASQGTYLWSKLLTTYTDGTQNTSYSVAYQGTNGTKGDPGSKDVPMTYVQEAQPSGTIVTNSLWWVGATMSSVTALKRWDGSSWIPDTIPQAVLNIIELNAVTINSATINSPTINVPFTHASIEGSGVKSTGKLSMHGTSYSIDGNIEDYNGKPNGQNYHTELNPDGLLSYITQTDGTTKMDVSRVAMGTLELEHLVSGLGTKATYITSSLNAEKIFQLNETGQLLWSGKTRLGDNQSITPSLPMTSCLNGWKIGIAIGGGNRFFWYHLAKEKAIESPNLGHSIPIFDFNVGGGGMYLYVSNTKLTGNSSVNLKGVAAAYYIYEVRAF